jgi:general secretion pathway protein G
MNIRTSERTLAQASRHGFTLVELLLVVAILGVLAGVVAVKFGGQGESARINATRASISAIKTAVEAYEIRMGRYPESIDDLTVGTDSLPPLLEKNRITDAWGNPFDFKKTGKYEFQIRSAGPDGQMGTGDDITN